MSKKDSVRERSKFCSPRHLEIARQEIQKLGAKLPGDSAEELDKWIAERRARWPSKANVERKRLEEAAREERGEIAMKKRPATLREQATGKFQGVSVSTGSKCGGPRLTDENMCKKRKTMASPLPSSAKEAVNESANVGDNLDSTSALRSLATQYAAGSSDEGEIIPEEGQLVESGQTGHPAGDACLAKARGDPRRGQRPRKRKGRRGVDSKKTHAPLPEAKPTLLRKLLEPEIREEQNIILQCIRILVRDGFFVEGKEALVSSGAK
jgi:hypothetical protein